MNKEKKIKIEKKEKRKKLLLEFVWFFEKNIPILSNNILLAEKAIKRNDFNESLNILLEATVQHNLETLIFNIYEMWGILNITLKDLNGPQLERNKSYEDLERIRNKLLGHRVENTIYFPKHIKWFKENYGRPSDVLDLLYKVGKKIKQRVQKLEKDGKISFDRLVIKESRKLTKEKLEKLIKAI